MVRVPGSCGLAVDVDAGGAASPDAFSPLPAAGGQSLQQGQPQEEAKATS